VVDFNTLSHAPPGSTPVTGGTVFRVWAPTSNQAWVRGEFNNWTLANPMTKLGGDFLLRVNGAHAGQAYKYFFDGATWNIDPRARQFDPGGGLSNSVIADPQDYTWTSGDFVAPPAEQMVVYQLNVGTFAGYQDPKGATAFPSTFADVTARVRHLAELGVNAVMLNPVTLSPNLTFAGYECMTPWTINNQYGTPAQFKALVDACHQNGIAVLCDIVWNHVPSSADILWNYNGTQLYFSNPPTQTVWGEQADFSVPQVADFYAQSALQTLEEYRVDGFRMDAVSAMAIGAKPAAGWALMQRFNDDIDRRYMDKVAIAEMFPVTGPVTNPTAVGGAGFDSQYNGDFETWLQYSVRSNRTGSLYTYLLPSFVTVPSGTAKGHQLLDYFELHDNAWSPPNHRFIRSLETPPGALTDSVEAAMRFTMGMLMLSPGMPAMLMGDEWLEDIDWGTAIANRIDWSKQVTHSRYQNYVHDLITTRINTPALSADAPSVLTHMNYGDGVVAWMRYDAAGQVYLAIANLGNSDFPTYLLGAPVAGAWTEILNSQAAAYGGTGMVNSATHYTYGESRDGLPQLLDIALPRSSVLLFRSLPATGVDAGALAHDVRIESIAPNPARSDAAVVFSLPTSAHTSVDVFDVQGARVARLMDAPLAAGRHVARWDGRDASGRAVPGGVYFVNVKTPSATISRRIAIIR
jgi:1,4-alpha-glucan branching enzyme